MVNVNNSDKVNTNKITTTNKLSKMMAEADNRYVLVHAVAKRAKKIMEGTSQSNLEISNNKAISTAIQEIIAEEARQQ